MNWAFLPYKRYADFSGRSRRKEYWSFYLFFSLANLILYILPYFADTEFESPYGYITIALYGLFFLVTIIPSLAVLVRRLHDTGKSGWYYFICLIPFVGSFILFIFTLQDSEPGENQYGPNPKEEVNPNLPTNF